MIGDVGEAEAGEYEHKFTFELPRQLPTSFEGVYGNVRYHVRSIQLFYLNQIYRISINYEHHLSLISNGIPQFIDTKQHLT